MSQPSHTDAPRYFLFSPSSSYPEPIACLLDGRARCVHVWSNATDQLDPATNPPTYLRGWNHVELAPDGGLFVTVPRRSLLKLDRESRIIWRAAIAAHHDVDVDAGGMVHVLAQQPRLVPWGGTEHVILDDTVTVLDPDGQPVAVHSLYELLVTRPELRHLIDNEIAYRRNGEGVSTPSPGSRAPGAEMFAEIGALDRFTALRHLHELTGWPCDVLHANALEVLQEHPQGLWQAGDVLVSVRNLNLIAVLSLETAQVRWWWGPGHVSRQHQPSMLPNGNILVFDNGYAIGRSRVLELDPVTRSIVWQYGTRPGESFFSPVAGGSELLDNGNVLITDARAGRAIEITRAGGVVGETVVERMSSQHSTSQVGIYRMSAVPAGRVADAGLAGRPDLAHRLAHERGLR
ncbi:arylsulfotransferase family protein, partial [Actinoplanes sp. NPDC048791]|uniref:arylsulfotransferase family protein n=1 Tax=Actinoplanes sp. NPDC048791 TaxID=3154623 RepID=UPI00341129A4